MLTGLHGRYVGGHCYAVQFLSKNYEKNLLVVSLPYLFFAFICFHILL